MIYPVVLGIESCHLSEDVQYVSLFAFLLGSFNIVSVYACR